MKLLTPDVAYETTIPLAPTSGSYTTPVLFHCYWNGILNEKHYVSIKSCHHFHPHHTIILWLEANTPNEYNLKISKYAEIRQLVLEDLTKDTFLNKYHCEFSMLMFRADYIRSVLLYKYSGCWFDLDCFFLRSFDPLFYHYGSEICLYQWEHQNFPNNAIYICLQPKSESMKEIIEFIIQRNRGWGFCEANITYDLPLNLHVLPCSWFDPSWIKNPYNLCCDDLFKATTSTYTFDSFFKGAFCYHWHNRWDHTIAPSSIFKQLESLLDV